ncbi:NAD(P)/FAD-dependent oxidoreductase [Comamonadaceae bacterium OH3737_COT-264]|nr:NAD(P)/FAD-dependent oxidoreductase [Comamonadaceae bacterium OH3737_COT-264]
MNTLRKPQTALVIGAGVIGLATGRALALAGHEVIVLETARAAGTQTSSRNSEVIHAGIYYPPGSLKAALCVQGKEMLYEYCAARHIACQRLGKLIVATTPAQQAQLEAIAQRAYSNGVDDLQPLTQAQAQALEPALHCESALLSPSTGIIDSHALMLALRGDLEDAGGMIAFISPVQSIDCTHPDGRKRLRTEDGTVIEADIVVNAAGHGAIPLAQRTQGLAAQHIPKAWFVKGQYFTLSGPAPFSRLIYPVPQTGGLGIHLTLDLGGQARFGPDVQWVEHADDLHVDPAQRERFAQAIRSYWPALDAQRLQPGYAGIRPNIGGPGEAAPDFIIQGASVHGIAGLVNLFGIESPGLTSCLAIAQRCAQAVTD